MDLTERSDGPSQAGHLILHMRNMCTIKIAIRPISRTTLKTPIPHFDSLECLLLLESLNHITAAGTCGSLHTLKSEELRDKFSATVQCRFRINSEGGSACCKRKERKKVHKTIRMKRCKTVNIGAEELVLQLDGESGER